LLNVAVGGDWPGNPDETTVFPQTMLVDYVRVYQRTPSDSPAYP
jgi:beta-glucanase (GH16 family)